MINKNKRNGNSIFKPNKMMTLQFFVIYFTLIIVLSLFSISSSSAVTTQRPTDQSSITYTDDSQEAAVLPTTLPTIKPSVSPTLPPIPTVSPKLTTTVTPKSTLLVPSPSPNNSLFPTEPSIAAIILPSPTAIISTPLPTSTKSSMSQILLALLTILSFAGIVISLILLIANKLKRRRIKPYVIALLISLAIFIISALFFVSIG